MGEKTCDKLSAQEVFAAMFISKMVNDTRQRTPRVVFTLSKDQLHGKIHIGYEKSSGRPLILNALHCFIRKKFGREEKLYILDPRCDKCSFDWTRYGRVHIKILKNVLTVKETLVAHYASAPDGIMRKKSAQ